VRKALASARGARKLKAMGIFTVALLQLDQPSADLDRNAHLGEEACRAAARMGADLALFPEMWSNGYQTVTPEVPDEILYRHPSFWSAGGRMSGQDAEPAARRGLPSADAVWGGQPVAADGPFVSRFRELAAQLGMAIALTYLQQWPGNPRNAVSVIDRHGAVVDTYAKVHTCAFGMPEAALTAGDRFRAFELDTAAGSVALGSMICYDREFPESARALMLAGAEILLVPNACELETNRLAQIRTRAYENMAGIAVANYAGEGCGGRSVAFDGMAFGPEGSRDMLIAEAGPEAGISTAVFDIDALRAYRRYETWGDAFRRPSVYASISAQSTVTLPVFVRTDNGGARPKR
jgi:N-carbamoylputrescine amidase